MLAFLTSLRHPQNSSDYGRVEELLRATVSSVDNQADRNFVFVICGNRVPAFPLPESIIFQKVDFPPPSQIRGPGIEREAILRDKGSKLAVGMLACRHLRVTHFMTVDADDFVSCRLAGFVRKNPHSTGWFLEDGYLHSQRRGLICKIKGFNELCGSSHIYRSDLIPIPEIQLDSSQDEVLEAFGGNVVLDLLGSHKYMKSYCNSVGMPLAQLPFPGAAYNVETTENWSENVMNRVGRPVSARLAAEFGLEQGGMRSLVHALTAGLTIPATRGMNLLRELLT